MVSGRTRVCGLIANPVDHSMSPLMQNYYSEQTGVDTIYVPFKVEKDQVGAAVKGAHALNLLGLNVTVPHKQQVMQYLEEIEEAAQAIGAVNTLVRTDCGYKGYNTDAAGLLRAVTEKEILIRDCACILLGAGGAAKAVAYMLASQGARVVYILNRSLEKAKDLADHMNRLFQREILLPMELEAYRNLPSGSYLAFQSTSVGMYPHCDEELIDDTEFYRQIHTGVDLVYTPMETKFMKGVAAAGGRTLNGLDMLIYQGIAAFELWHPGVKIDTTLIAEAKELLLRQLNGNCVKKNVILIGFMGAGKTSVGQVLAESSGCPLIDTDQLIEAKAGLSISEIFKIQGEEIFRQYETQVLKELREDTRGVVIAVGGGLPLREENQKILKELGTVVYLKVQPDTVLVRLKGDVTRPLLQGNHVRQNIEELMDDRSPIYEAAADLVVLVDGKPLEMIAEEIRETGKC